MTAFIASELTRKATTPSWGGRPFEDGAKRILNLTHYGAGCYAVTRRDGRCQ